MLDHSRTQHGQRTTIRTRIPPLLAAPAGLGLNAYEARSYLVLVGHPRFKALELAARAHVPRQKIYEVLDSLVEKGFAQVIQDSTKLFSAVPPDQAVPGLSGASTQRRSRACANKRKAATRTIERSDVRVHGGAGRQRHARLSCASSAIRARRGQFRTMLAEAQRRVSGVFPAAVRGRSAGCRTGDSGARTRGPVPADRGARNTRRRAPEIPRGVRERGRPDPADRQSPDENGGDGRPQRVAGAGGPGDYQAGMDRVVFEHEGMAEAMKSLFEDYWRRATSSLPGTAPGSGKP